MKKRIIINKPDDKVRGQYVFFDNAEYEYSASNGLPPDADKFDEKDLYTNVISDEKNELIIRYELQYPGYSFINIEELIVKNTGTGHRLHNGAIRAWIFDNFAYANAGGHSNGPFSDGYSKIWSVINSDTLKNSKFYDWGIGTVNARSWSPNTIISDATIVNNLSSFSTEVGYCNISGIQCRPFMDDTGASDCGDGDYCVAIPDPGEPFFGNQYSDFDAQTSFGIDPSLEPTNNPLIKNSFESDLDQNIYIVVWCQGDDKRKGIGKYYTDHRERRMHIFKIKSDELFGQDFVSTKETFREFTYSDANIKQDDSGGSGWFNASSPAFKVTSLKMRISTNPSSQNPVGNEFVNKLTGSILTPRSIDLNNFDESFLQQHPLQEIYNLNWPPYFYGQNQNNIKENFDPVANIKVFNNPNYDFQAYQTSSIDRQICSAPGQVSLDFDISEYFEVNDTDLNNDGSYKSLLGYKFFVVDWNDTDDVYETFEDYHNKSPDNFFELIEKRKNDTYNFSDVGVPLLHNYQTPGVKTIKSIVFSHTLDGRIQIVRWKLVTSRIFLDIPISEYPDFEQVGGPNFVTLPWPTMVPVINGTHQNSRYKNSVKDILASGKIGSKDIIDERFLYEDSVNNEQGKSIENFDLEQVRYFNKSYDMQELLRVDNRYDNPLPEEHYSNTNYWDCDDWDAGRVKCFSDETSVGEIFIDDNLDSDLVKSCKLELNTGNIDDNSIFDSSGNGSKGILFGDYKIKKLKKGIPMKRDSYIRYPKKADKSNGAL